MLSDWITQQINNLHVDLRTLELTTMSTEFLAINIRLVIFFSYD